MHKLILVVFKVLGLTIILTFMFRGITIGVDIINVESRVKDIEVVLKTELMRHNSIPDEMGVAIDNKLKDIVAKSDMAINYRWNWKQNITTLGVTYKDISESNVQDYGKTLDYVIQIDMSLPVFSTGNPNNPSADEKSASSFWVEDAAYRYVSTHSDSVTALRYLR